MSGLSMDTLKKFIAGWLAACVLTAAPGGACYAALGTALKPAPRTQAVKPLSPGYLHFLRYQGVLSESSYQALTQSLQKNFLQAYLLFAKKTLETMRAQGLLRHPYWSNKLLDSNLELTPLAVELGWLLQSAQASLKQVSPAQALAPLQRLFEKDPKLLADPEKMRGEIHSWFENANRAAPAAHKAPAVKAGNQPVADFNKNLPLNRPAVPAPPKPADGNSNPYNRLKEKQIQAHQILSDPKKSQEALAAEWERRRKAVDLAAAKTMIEMENPPKGKNAPSLLGDQLKALEQAEKTMQVQIRSYERSREILKTYQELYQILIELSRSDELFQNMVKAATGLVQTLLLKRGFHFLALAVEKLKKLQELLEEEKKANLAGQKQLEKDRQWAAERLKTAENLLARALGGEFTDKVREDIKKIQDAKAEADKIKHSIGNVKDLLRGGFGDLTKTFMDPEAIREEIKDWRENLETINENYQKAFFFIDPLRNITHTEADEFGDFHFKSAHLWSQQAIAEMNAAEALLKHHSVDIHRTENLFNELEKNPNAFYVGAKGDPELQAKPEDARKLILRRQGQAILAFATQIIKFKVAEATLNGISHAYKKDPAFSVRDPQEIHYERTMESITKAKARARELVTFIVNELEFVRPRLVEEEVVTDEEVTELQDRVREEFRNSIPEGYAHRAYAVTKKAKKVIEDSLFFSQFKYDYLSSGPNFFQILQSGLLEKQSGMADRQLEMADELLDFLQNHHLPAEAGKADTYEGFVTLYGSAYKALHNAYGKYYEKEQEGMEEFEKTLKDLSDPFLIDFKNVKEWLSKVNPRNDPAIRRMGRALAAPGDRSLERLRKKSFIQRLAKNAERERRSLERTAAEVAARRDSVKRALELARTDDPSYALAREALLAGELLYDGGGAGLEQGSRGLFVKKSVLQRILSQAAASGGKRLSASEWISGLGLDNYEVIPMGEGPDAFYTVVKFSAGLPVGKPMKEMFENAENESLFKMGNIARWAGGNLSLTFYDWKELGGAPLGSRGLRVAHERDNLDEKLINTTVLDIHQNLQQGDIFRVMMFEDMALMVLKDRLYLSLTGFADLPVGEGRMEKGEDAAPYLYGGRGKAVFHLHEIASLNAEMMGIFAKDPYEFVREINTSIDPLAMKEETISIQGAIIQYIKRHAGVEIDLGKLIDKRQTLSMEFFLEDEKIRETANGEVSEEYRRDFKDDFSKVWKGAKLLKEIHFDFLGGRSTVRAEARAAWDQDGEMEPSGKLAFLLSQGVVFEAMGARYGGKTTAKGSVNLRLPYGNEIYAAYGTDRLATMPRLSLGLRNSITLEELRRGARDSLEKAFHGGDTLADFMELFDKKMPRHQAGQPLTLAAGIRRIFEHDPRLKRTLHAIGQRERNAVDLQWAFKAGLQINAGYMYGRGYEGVVDGMPQSAYGNSSTAGGKNGGIQVGGELFLGWTETQKETAVREIAKIKSLLVDLRGAYEDSMQEFRLASLRMLTAKLRAAQIDQLAAHQEVKENAALSARLEQERIRARSEAAAAEALLRAKMGLGLKDPLPRELEQIAIDPANPAKTLEAASKVLTENEDWKKLLRTLAKASAKQGASLDLSGKILNTVNPLQILPLVDDLTLSIGGNMWDITGNSFFGVGGQVRLSVWDPEKKVQKRIKELEIKISDLETEEKLILRQMSKKVPARFDRWALLEQKRMLEELLAKLSRNLKTAPPPAQRLALLEQILSASRELSRAQMELLSLPQPEPQAAKKGVEFSTLPEMARQAVERPQLGRRLALQRALAEKMEEAAKERFSFALRLGARWNPVSNVWYETATQTFFTGGQSLLLPILDLTVKSKGLIRKEEEIAKTLGAAMEDDHKLQLLDIKRQLSESYLRLLYFEQLKGEMAEKMRKSRDPAEFTQLGVDILELRKAAGHEGVRLLVLLGLDPEAYELDLSSLKKRDPRKESALVRPWVEENLKNASEIKKQALESRIRMVQAMEGKILMMERAKNIRTEPISYLMQAAVEILTSIFSQGGLDTAAQSQFDAMHRYRKNLEMELHRFKDQSKLMARRSEARLIAAAQKLERDNSAQNQMEFELARAAHAAEGWAPGPNGARPLLSLDGGPALVRPPALQWGARIYQTEEALPKPDKIGKKNVYYQNAPGKDVVFVEGMMQLMLKNPHRIKPGMFARIEELDRERELRWRRLESDMKQAKLSGLLWKYRYLTGQLDQFPDGHAQREILLRKIQETQNLVEREHGLKPPQYPHPLPHSPLPVQDLKTLADQALKFLVGDSPLLGPLSVDLAQGRVYGQNILENLRYQSMNPSLALGYLRKGMVGGIFITSPHTGMVPGSNVFQDIESLVAQNMDAALSTGDLITEARERLASNAVRIPYLLDEIAQANAFLAALKEELARDPGNTDLLIRFHLAYENSLDTIAELHGLYLETETDLKLLGVRVPKNLGRSSRDPWTAHNRRAMIVTPALSAHEALKLGKEFNPALLAGWESLPEQDRKKRLAAWQKDLEHELSELPAEEKRRIQEMAEEIRKEGFSRHERPEMAGVLSLLDSGGSPNYDLERVLSLDQLEELRAQNRLHAYHPVTGAHLGLEQTLFDGAKPRILAAPAGFTGQVPQNASLAAQAGFSEFLESSGESERRFKEARGKLEKRVLEKELDLEYHKSPESFILVPSEAFLGLPGAAKIKTIRVMLEEEALAAVKNGALNLWRGSGNQRLDPAVLAEKHILKMASLKIYLDGDYRFTEAETGERVWTLEELLRENRLLVFLEDTLTGGLRRTEPDQAFAAESGRPPVSILAYFGSTPELLASAEHPEELKEFARDLRVLSFSEKGDKGLKRRAKEDLRRATQASLVYLKTAYGFKMKGNTLEAVYLTEKSFEKAKSRNPASELFLSSDLSLYLDAEGHILRAQIKNLAGETVERDLRPLYENAGPVAQVLEGKKWGKLGVDPRDFRVKQVFSQHRVRKGLPGQIGYLYDDFNFYPIHKNRFPGFGRILAMVDPEADTLLLDPTEKLSEMVDDSESDLTRVQIRPWMLTLGLAFNITSGFALSSWTMPLSATVGAGNVADRVAALTGEGAMDQELPPVLEQIWGIVNFLFFEKIIPQLQDKLYDPSGYPKIVAKDPPSFFDKLLYYATFTLAGRKKDRLVEVDPQTNKITRRVVTLGAVAVKRQIATLKQDYENSREQILAAFRSGITVRETKMNPGVFGDWRQTQVHTLSRGAAYEQVMESLKNLGVRFAPDGSFDLEILPHGTRVSGSKIRGVSEAEQNLKTAEERQNYHQDRDGFLWGPGGVVRYRFKEGELEKRELAPGAAELESWRAAVQKAMRESPEIRYNPRLKMYMHPSGSWMYNAETASLVLFNEQGHIQELIQAVFSPETLKNRYRQEKLQHEFFRQYPELLSQGGIVRLDTEGRLLSFSLGREALRKYQRDRGRPEEVLPAETVLERPDGGRDMIVHPLHIEKGEFKR